MRVHSAFCINNYNCLARSSTNKTNLMLHNKYPQQPQKQLQNHVHHEEGIHNNKMMMLWSLPVKKPCNFLFAFIFIALFMQHYIVTFASAAAAVTASAAYNDRIYHSSSDGDVGVAKGLKTRMRSPKIAGIHILQPIPESLPKNQKNQDHHHQSHNNIAAVVNGKRPPVPLRGAIDNLTNTPPAGKFEIHSVSGEPNYKSVNLTWEVEFVPSMQDNIVSNSSAEVQPPTSFQIFFCEIQSFGPHRCRSKVINESSSTLEMYDNEENDLEFGMDKTRRQVRQYVAQVDNLRMATKYSFHIRSASQRKNMKVTGRSELFDNEIEGEDFLTTNMAQGQTIIIPTKGFSAQATRCLPTASEIEVETGPYFGGKIVVDGGNCGIKGDSTNSKEKYVMRIDHKICGSLVKPETNTVETFITVQENLGIFTHSTRRFVVVCSYQSGLQTVRASFTVPGRGGAAAVQQDNYDDERMGRGLRPMRFVGKGELVLKETTEEEAAATSEETQAVVEEMDNPTINYNKAVAEDDTEDTPNAKATLENITPTANGEYQSKQTEVNENEHQNETGKTKYITEFEDEEDNSVASSNTTIDSDDDGDDDDNDEVKTKSRNENYHEQISANFAKLTSELNDEQETQIANRVVTGGDNDDNILGPTYQGRGFHSGLELITLNMGSVMLTVLLSVILIGVFVYVLYRETKLPGPLKQNADRASSASSSSYSSSPSTTSLNSSRRYDHPTNLQEVDNTLPRTLRTKN